MKIYFNRVFLLLIVFCFIGVSCDVYAATSNNGQTLSVTVDNSMYEIPDTPTIVRSENIATTAVDLVVQVGNVHANNNVDFVLTITNVATGEVTTQNFDQNVDNSARTTLPASSLVPGTTYRFTVRYSRDGQNIYSAESNVHTVTTLIDPPVLDSINNVSTSDATLNVVVNPAFVGSAMDFIVEVKNERTGDVYTIQMTRDVTSSSVALGIDDLDPGTEYSFRVRYGREGTGNLSGYSNQRAAITEMDPPSINDITDITTNSMNLMVEVDDAFSGETVDFTIEVTNKLTGDTYEVDITADVSGSGGVTLSIDGLDPGTEYDFRVKYAWENSSEYSDFSSSRTGVTEGETEEEYSEICHNGQTISIADSAIQTHLDHGDYRGPCTPEGGDGGPQPDLGGGTPGVEGIVSGEDIPVDPEEEEAERRKEELREAIIPEERKSVAETVAVIGATAGSIAALAGSAIPLFTAMPGAFSSSIFLKFIELFGIIGRRKEERNWGVVFDNITRVPIPAVKILLTDEEGKELATTYSDKDGRFGFLASPGTYVMHIFKKDYELLTDLADDELYGPVYNGGVFSIGENNVILANIAMKALNINWEEYSQKKIKQYRSKLSIVKKYFFIAVYVLGFGATVVVTYFYPTTFNFIVLGIYILLFIYQLFFKKKKYGMIETVEGKPVPFAVVSLHDRESDEKHRFAVTDSIGRYYLIADNGQYKMKAKGQPVSGAKFEKQGDIHVNDGIVRKDIVV